MYKIIVFSSAPSYFLGILLEGLQEAISARSDAEIAALVLDEETDYERRLRQIRMDRYSQCLKSTLTQSPDRKTRYPRPTDIWRWAERHGIRIVHPGARDINAPEFIRDLDRDSNPKIAFSIFCLQKFGEALLGSFEYAVNYHNGILPDYKGLWATHWSLYFDEPTTGFTIHHMTKALDAGPVLAQGSVDIEAGNSRYALEVGKTNRAVTRLPDVIDRIIAGDPGTPQVGEGRYFGSGSFRHITVVREPGRFTSDDLLKRIRIFGSIHARIDEAWHTVLSMNTAQGRRRRRNCFYFTASDGVLMEACLVRRGSGPASRLYHFAMNGARQIGRKNQA